jgi:hypothetical protein
VQKKPNIIVHLDVSPEESLRRIKSRCVQPALVSAGWLSLNCVSCSARGIESGITLEYLKALHAGYEEFIKEISRVIPVIKVDYEKFRTPEEMAEGIAEQYRDITNIRRVTFEKHGIATPSAGAGACSQAAADRKEASSPMELATPPVTPLKNKDGSATPGSGSSSDGEGSAVKRQLVLEH